MLSLEIQYGFGYRNLSYIVLQFSGQGNQLVSWTGGYEGHFNNSCLDSNNSLESSLISASSELNSKSMEHIAGVTGD